MQSRGYREIADAAAQAQMLELLRRIETNTRGE
jgi:hypothetical protein